MEFEQHVRRAQVYCFLADAFLYPETNWLEDLPLVAELALQAGLVPESDLPPDSWDYSLTSLQAEHRRAFGLTGSLSYETEFGLPHEFRQSQELADIAGFYQAFGFKVGGQVRERPDHLAVELEFMFVLSLKEAYAAKEGLVEQAEICRDGQAKFLKDHLGRWIGLLAESIARSYGQGLYLDLARFAAAFVDADARRLGVQLAPRHMAGILPTPLGPELSCGECPAFDAVR
jgi:putative dimethyl sulfoxide reductase chaperone